MKSSSKDIASGVVHQVKGKAKEIAGVIVGNSKLEIEGKIEKQAGKIQEKVGHVEKALDK